MLPVLMQIRGIDTFFCICSGICKATNEIYDCVNRQVKKRMHICSGSLWTIAKSFVFQQIISLIYHFVKNILNYYVKELHATSNCPRSVKKSNVYVVFNASFYFEGSVFQFPVCSVRVCAVESD